MRTWIALRQAGVRYGTARALDAVDLSIAEGETTVLLGRNGSGKSTLLRLLGGLAAPSMGSRTEGRRADGRPIVVGYAPDRLPVMPFGCAEYVRRLGEVRGMPAAELNRRLAALLDRFGMAAHAGVKLKHCSKGMLQKVNLMQAVIAPPDVLLLDEPLSGLDPRTQRELADSLAELKAEGAAIVFSAHETLLAETLADRAVVLEAGRIVRLARAADLAAGTAEIDCRFAGGAAVPPQPETLPGLPEASPMPGGVRYRVRAGEADALLAALLAAGGSIGRVQRSGGWASLAEGVTGREGA